MVRILQNGIPSTDELALLFPVHKPAVVIALKCFDPVDLSTFRRHVSNARIEDAKSIERLQATVDSLSTIHTAWRALKTQTEAAIDIAQAQLETAHSDQIRYNNVFTNIAQLTSAQEPNIDSLREWAIKNAHALQVAKVDWIRLEKRYRVYNVGLKAIAIAEGVVKESKRGLEERIREVDEKVEPLMERYSALKREMQDMRREFLENF
jgi:predicted  nucleic acid-binding Zn-ribbon protein